MNNVFIKIISVSWNKAILSFSLPVMSIVKVICREPKNCMLAQTEEECFIGRIFLNQLEPKTSYKVIVEWESGQEELEFTTLPVPIGDCLCKFAAIADTHISEKAENRKGRLFVESAMILSDIVEHINSEQMDFAIIAGDITNMSRSSEYARADEILSRMKCKCYVVPGDHDMLDKGNEYWQRHFGEKQWVEELECVASKKIQLIGVDTSNRRIGQEGIDWLKCNLKRDVINIIVSHFQLIPDDYIRGSNRKLIEDYEEYRQEIERLCEYYNMMIYVGHQNVPSKKYIGNSVQINLPQPVQFLCGYLVVQVYENGIYHSFVPITSEILNEHSRVFSECASSRLQEAHWRAEYRVGKDVTESNFIFVLSVD